MLIPKPKKNSYPMGEHRAMLRTMYMEDILHSTAKLHMHNWILMSRNEEYDNCGLGFLFILLEAFFLSFFLSFF